MAELQPDLIFLDVQMPGESGFDFLVKLDSFPAVIFTTAFDQFALKAFEFGAYDYLLKPVEPARLAASLVRMSDRESVRAPLPARRRNFCVKRIRFLFETERIAGWCNSPKFNCWSRKGITRESILKGSALWWRDRLNALEIRLDPKVFFRANRSQIVNLRWVQSIQPWFSRGLRIKLRSGSEVEISRRRSQQFRDLTSL